MIYPKQMRVLSCVASFFKKAQANNKSLSCAPFHARFGCADDAMNILQSLKGLLCSHSSIHSPTISPPFAFPYSSTNIDDT